MKPIKEIISKSIKKTMGKVAVIAGAIAYETKHEKKTECFLNEDDGHSKLIVAQKPYTLKESFKIYDSLENVKYIVKGKLVSAIHNLTVYDASGKIVLGRVREQLISLRSPLSLEQHPQDFIIEMDGKKLGKMKSRFAFGKRKFEFTFNNWVLEGNILGLKYKVFENKEIIMQVQEKAFSTGDFYYLDITNPDNELLCVLILLAIDSSHTSKSHDNSRTIKHKIWPLGF